MKYLILIPAFILIGLLNSDLFIDSPKTIDRQSISPVIGDESFVATFGVKPDAQTDECLRIQTHLSYVEQQLRDKNTSHLSAELQARRTQTLDLLQAYHEAQQFPKNYDHAGERRPCFIDKDDNICAVGYLVEQTAGMGLARKINQLFQYADIHEMNLPALAGWAATTGLSIDEIAMIQPAYGEHVSTPFAVSSAALSGVNLSLAGINYIQLQQSPTGKALPIIGLATGAGQLALGIAHYPTNNSFGEKGTTRLLSLADIAIGAGTIVMSSYNLSTHSKRKKRLSSFNIYSAPTDQNNMAYGLHFSRRF